MPYNANTARDLSLAFRQWASSPANIANRPRLEQLLYQVLAPRDIRNVQLWTRTGLSQQRNFINSAVSEMEFDLRVWLVERFALTPPPNFPVKIRTFVLPLDGQNGPKLMAYLFDNYIREYGTRLFFNSIGLVVEYAADSSNNPEDIDLDAAEMPDQPAPEPPVLGPDGRPVWTAPGGEARPFT